MTYITGTNQACATQHLHAVHAGNAVSASEEYCTAKIESIWVRRDQGPSPDLPRDTTMFEIRHAGSRINILQVLLLVVGLLSPID